MGGEAEFAAGFGVEAAVFGVGGEVEGCVCVFGGGCMGVGGELAARNIGFGVGEAGEGSVGFGRFVFCFCA